MYDRWQIKKFIITYTLCLFKLSTAALFSWYMRKTQIVRYLCCSASLDLHICTAVGPIFYFAMFIFMNLMKIYWWWKIYCRISPSCVIYIILSVCCMCMLHLFLQVLFSGETIYYELLCFFMYTYRHTDTYITLSRVTAAAVLRWRYGT